MKLATLFSNHLVFQQNQPIKLWGWDTPGASVVISFLKKDVTGRCDDAGRFEVSLEPQSHGGPHELTASGSSEITLCNVMIGEVWVCSGQSNMQFSLQTCDGGAEEIAKADHPTIRLFTVPRELSDDVQDDIEASWLSCSPETISDFSGVAYHFGLDLHQASGVPIGLISCNWGGTCAETWTSREKLLSMPRYADGLRRLDENVENTAAVRADYQKGLDAWTEETFQKDPGVRPEDQMLTQLAFNDSDWRTMTLPSSWQAAGENYSGVFWFRKNVSIPEAWLGKKLTLLIGAIDKTDDTFVNGVWVGGLDHYKDPECWSTLRRYPVNACSQTSVQIAVRVYSHCWYGGICGSPDSLALLGPAGEALPLAGEWKFHVSHNFGLVDLGSAPPAPLLRRNANAPSNLYDQMLRPLIPYSIAGVIWYQGQSNANEPQVHHYHELFSAMICDWRERWNRELPFYFVQLANWDGAPIGNWPHLREAQTKTLTLPATGMATAIDIGIADDIHPTNKKDVGARLARLARNQLYGEPDLEISGPVCQSVKRDGASVLIDYDHADGIHCTGTTLNDFELTNGDGTFHPAIARIEKGGVIVESPEVDIPAAIRYAWTNCPAINLFNSDKLPAMPFWAQVRLSMGDGSSSIGSTR